MKRLSLLFFIIYLFLGISKIQAHVSLQNPKGGETFTVGEMVSIQWKEEVSHNPNSKWNLYFSADGGSNWEIIEEEIIKSQTEYDWTVPDFPTQFGEIRVVQDNGPTLGNYYDISGNFTITNNTTSVNNLKSLPQTFALFQNYPNPFNPTTKISFTIPNPGDVNNGLTILKIYNILGKELATLINGNLAPGKHEIEFNADNLPSGVYLYRLSYKNFSQSKKMTVIK